MATITVYSFEDADGNEFGTYTTQEYEEAKDHGQIYGLRVIANEYEFSDSHLVDDFTPRLTEDEWEEKWEEALADHDFGRLAVQWHGGQWSDFYKLQCNGRILDKAHANGVAAEARGNLEGMTPDHEDYDAMKALMEIADIYPGEADDESEEEGD